MILLKNFRFSTVVPTCCGVGVRDEWAEDPGSEYRADDLRSGFDDFVRCIDDKSGGTRRARSKNRAARHAMRARSEVAAVGFAAAHRSATLPNRSRDVVSPAPRPTAPAPAAPRPLVQPRGSAPSRSGSTSQTRASRATKTTARLIETPQAVSVVGAEQIRDQAPRNSTRCSATRPA